MSSNAMRQAATIGAMLASCLANSISVRAQTIISVNQISYDEFGRVKCSTVRMNPAKFANLPVDACASDPDSTNDRITRNVYDSAGQQLQERRAVGTSLEQAYVTYSYTLNGLREYVIDANGQRAKLEYDGFGRQIRWVFPSPVKPTTYNTETQATALATAGALNTADYEEYGYDANNNRTSLRKRDGRTLVMSYDDLNRVTKKVVPDDCVAGYACTTPPASAIRDVYYGYNLQGLQTFARFDSSTGEGVTSGYDSKGRLTSTTTNMAGASRTLTYAYDLAGNRKLITQPGAIDFTYTYDAANRLSGLYEGSGTSIPITTFSYNAAGFVASRAERYGSAVTFGYDAVGRLTSQADSFSTSKGGVTVGFSYNAANQIVSRTRSNAAYAFAGYVNASNAYAANGLNRYTSVGSVTFGYDANGNLTSDGTTSYTYDVENRLVTASNGVALIYDPLGRLFQTSGGIAGITQFLYDGDNLAAEYSGSGALLRRFVHGVGRDEPLVWYEGATLTAPIWLHTDHQGSVVALAQTSPGVQGQATAFNRYDEYGVPGADNTGRFQYSGQAWLPELGMYYYKARIYAPTLGRFLQTDPVGYEDQINLYAYAANDPINGRDPTGMEDVPLCPGNDPLCYNPAVVAPLTSQETARQERLEGLDQPSGTLTEIAGSAISNAIFDTLSQIDPTDAIDNAATAARIGAAGEAAVAEEIAAHGWTVADSHVTIESAAGIRVADFLLNDGKGGYLLVEVKANSAVRSFSQARKDYIIETYGGRVRSRSGVVEYGSNIKIPTIVIRVTVTR